jgi:hydroxypyruvate reductase
MVVTQGKDDVPPLVSLAGGHPTPTPASEEAGRRALAVAVALHSDEKLIVLLSGGASSLMAVPAAGITLDDKRRATTQLLLAGADIHALNTVRKHLSAIKGGWLAAAAGVCRAFVISDVVDDDLSVIGSGPTVADTSTFVEALEIIERFGGARAYPNTIIARLRAGARGEIPETPKPGDRRLACSETTVVGGRRELMTGAAADAARRGYHVLRVDDAVVGEARAAAVAHVRAIRARATDIGRPACIISSGETTVRVVGSGKGGRNQEFVLAAAGLLAGDACTAALASVGTDGIDGPTDAAGGMVDSSSQARSRAAGVDFERDLADNNAYAALDALGDLIRTGPTGTNAGDLQVLLIS